MGKAFGLTSTKVGDLKIGECVNSALYSFDSGDRIGNRCEGQNRRVQLALTSWAV